MDFGRLVGLSAIQLRALELLQQLWLGLESWCGCLLALVERRGLDIEHRLRTDRLSAAALAASAAEQESDSAGQQKHSLSGNRSEQASAEWIWRVVRVCAAWPGYFGDHCRACGHAGEDGSAAHGL
jgi:hypothetical protein